MSVSDVLTPRCIIKYRCCCSHASLTVRSYQKSIVGYYSRKADLLFSRISSRIGIPSLLDRDADLHNISCICDTRLQSSSVLATRCGIQRIFARSTAALQAQPDEGSRIALILMFSSDLDGFRFKTATSWDSETELQFLGAKLFLLGWSFPYFNQSEVASANTSKAPTSRKIILHEAMRVSLKMMHVFCELGSSRKPSQPSLDLDEPLPVQIYQPKVAFFEIYYAVLTLYLFLSHFPSPTQSDVDLAFNHIRDTHTLLVRCAGDNDKHEWARAAFSIDLIGRWHASGRKLPPEAAIKSRMGASLFYDAVQKQAVLKAEQGGRSYTSDLTQPLPDRETQMLRKAGYNALEGGNEAENVITTEAHNAVALNMDVPSVQEGPLDQTGLLPGWDESIWGCDFNLLDASQIDADFTNVILD